MANIFVIYSILLTVFVIDLKIMKKKPTKFGSCKLNRGKLSLKESGAMEDVSQYRYEN